MGIENHVRKYVVKTTHDFFSASFERKDYSCCPPIVLTYEPIPYCSSCQIWLGMRYNKTCLLIFFFEDRCLNRCNILFALFRVEDCLELNFFKCADYHTLAYYPTVLVSVHVTGAQHFLSVRVLISASTIVLKEVEVVVYTTCLCV